MDLHHLELRSYDQSEPSRPLQAHLTNGATCLSPGGRCKPFHLVEHPQNHRLATPTKECSRCQCCHQQARQYKSSGADVDATGVLSPMLGQARAVCHAECSASSPAGHARSRRPPSCTQHAQIHRNAQSHTLGLCEAVVAPLTAVPALQLSAAKPHSPNRRHPAACARNPPTQTTPISLATLPVTALVRQENPAPNSQDGARYR